MTPEKKLLFIILLFGVALFISLPANFTLFDRKFTRPDLDLRFGSFEIKKNFDLIFGLDLAGGSHLVFEADVSGIPDSQRRESAIEGVRDVIERRVNLFGISEPNVQTSTFAGKDRIIVELPGIKEPKEAIELIGKTAQLSFAEVSGEAEEQTLIPTDLTGADLARADVTFDQTTGKPVVTLEFTSEGGNKFAEITGKNVAKQLPILLDGQVISAPVVQEQITGGSAIISGEFTLDEAKTLAIQLNAGALPVPISLVEERTVGATLGAESVERSVKAGLVGVAMVLVFMVAAYGKLGIVADLGLIIFGVLTLALYKLIPVVLTLPGIAGFLLSVGMAVDSNILIF